MDRVARLRNDANDLLDTHLVRPGVLECGPGNEPAVVDREQHRVKERQVGSVEGAVDEDAALEGLRDLSANARRGQTAAARASWICCSVTWTGFTGEPNTR